MGAKVFVRHSMEKLLRSKGYEIIDRAQAYEWQLGGTLDARHNPSAIPEDLAAYLSPQNAFLETLKQRYGTVDTRVTDPVVWRDGYIGEEQLRYFRGDNGYVWQLRGTNMNPLGYALTTYYVLALDRLGLMDRLQEDDRFGNFTFTIADRTISRDLLDSVIELHFIDKHLGLAARENFRILDVGAGYGRLAYRTVTAFPNTEYLCTDAVPVSTFTSDFYLRFRQVDDRAKVVPLDEIEDTLATKRVDLAVNMHSFSECRLEAIEWWVSLLRKSEVPALMIVPNGDRPELCTNDGEDFQHIIERHGYRLTAREPKFTDAIVQKYGINPSYYFLFRL